MDFRSMIEENKKNIIILGGIILVALIIVMVFSGIKPKSDNEKATYISFDYEEIDVIEDDTYELNYTILPSDLDAVIVNWSSSNESVATVDKDGVITTIRPGVAVIVGKVNDKVLDSLTLNVTEKNKNDETVTFNIENFDLKVGTYRRIYPIFTPIDLEYDSISWTSSNDSVATVSKIGRIYGVKEGVAVITATIKINDSLTLMTSSTVTITKKTTLSVSKSNTSIDKDTTSGITIAISDSNVSVKQIVGETENENIAQIIRRPLVEDDSKITLIAKGVGIGKTNFNLTMETTSGEIVNLVIPITVK